MALSIVSIREKPLFILPYHVVKFQDSFNGSGRNLRKDVLPLPKLPGKGVRARNPGRKTSVPLRIVR